MGRWRQETDIYGERERWIPDFRGEWPADDAHLLGVMEGVVPSPCPTCSGELVRRTKSPDCGPIYRQQDRQERQIKFAIAAGKEPPVFPSLPTPTQQRIYDIACYRGPHGIERHGKTPDGKPMMVGKVLDLVPADRTADWSDR